MSCCKQNNIYALCYAVDMNVNRRTCTRFSFCVCVYLYFSIFIHFNRTKKNITNKNNIIRSFIKNVTWHTHIVILWLLKNRKYQDYCILLYCPCHLLEHTQICNPNYMNADFFSLLRFHSVNIFSPSYFMLLFFFIIFSLFDLLKMFKIERERERAALRGFPFKLLKNI